MTKSFPSWPVSAAQLASYLDVKVRCGDEHAIASRLAVSSQLVESGTCFIAIPGVAADGHRYVPEAVAKGASVIITQAGASCAPLAPNIAQIEVKDSRRAASQLAAWYYRYPSRSLQIVGITGTNGKTSSNWFVYHLLKSLGIPCMRLGTLGAALPHGVESLAMRTTPNAVQLQELLSRGCEQGAKAAVLEVSSHALDQCRAEDLEFDVVAFTNLTRDHLDYHGDMERYFHAKRHLFTLAERSIKPLVTAVVCVDDPYGQRLADEVSSKGLLNLITIGFSPHAVLRAKSYEVNGGFTTLHFSSPEGEGCVTYPFIGAHNALNMLTALGCLRGLGISKDRWDAATQIIPPISGRLELVYGDGPIVFVDYAHTPDALEKALCAAREVTKGTLWVVFGCGGDRDPGKRPIMATVASRFADRVVLTSDNPRTEDPAKIIQEALDCPSGSAIRARGIVEVDRAKAIAETLRRAEPQDVVVIAGKGHEDYQIFGTEKVHFSDQEQVRSFYTARHAPCLDSSVGTLGMAGEGEAA